MNTTLRKVLSEYYQFRGTSHDYYRLIRRIEACVRSDNTRFVIEDISFVKPMCCWVFGCGESRWGSIDKFCHE
jgi:hypothetical protein